MGSRVIVFLGLLLAMVLFISSEVAARGLAQATNTVDASKEVEETSEAAVNDAKYPDEPPQYKTKPFCLCCGDYGCSCCSFAGEKVNAEPQAKPQN